MDAARLQVSHEEIDKYYENLMKSIMCTKSVVLFNADETGQDDYCDTEEISLIVRSSFVGNIKSYPVTRDSRRTTVLHCICADGTYLPPMFIEKRDSIDSDVLKFIDPTIASIFPQNKGFMTTDAFDIWIRQIFVPHIIEKKNRQKYSGNTVLLLDNFVAHEQAVEKNKILLDANRIEIIWLVPHASDQLQPFDLGIFGVQKRLNATEKKRADVSIQASKYIRLLSTLQKASTSENIIKAFEIAGIGRQITKILIPSWKDAQIYPIEYLDKAKAVRHFSRSYLENTFPWYIHIPDYKDKTTKGMLSS